MVKRLKLNVKTVREAANVGRDYQIFDTDVQWGSVTIYPTGNRALTMYYRAVWVTIGRCPASLASVPVTANYKQ